MVTCIIAGGHSFGLEGAYSELIFMNSRIQKLKTNIKGVSLYHKKSKNFLLSDMSMIQIPPAFKCL